MKVAFVRLGAVFVVKEVCVAVLVALPGAVLMTALFKFSYNSNSSICEGRR